MSVGVRPGNAGAANVVAAAAKPAPDAAAIGCASTEVMAASCVATVLSAVGAMPCDTPPSTVLMAACKAVGVAKPLARLWAFEVCTPVGAVVAGGWFNKF